MVRKLIDRIKELFGFLVVKIKEYPFIFTSILATLLVIGVVYFDQDWKWLIAILTPTVLYYNYSLNRMSIRRQGILDVLSMYYTQDLLEGTKKLYDLYRKFNDPKDFPRAYVAGLKTPYRMWNLKSEDGGRTVRQTIKIDNELNHQRRTVSHFWITLGTLLQHGMVDENIVCELWSRDDVGIVENIIIPIENELSEKYDKHKLPDNHPLCYIRDNNDKFYKGGITEGGGR